MEVCIIVAISTDNAIGRGNDMIWHIREDLKQLKRVTMGSPVIMGRRTYESIGRPLPGRLNIVISRTMGPTEGIVLVGSLEEALEVAGKAAEGEGGTGRCFIMGGGQVYARSMNLADRLFVTHVDAPSGGADTYFPQIDPQIWEEESRSEEQLDPASGHKFSFATYSRKTNLACKEKISAAD